MSIVKMTQFSLLALNADKEQLLHDLQKFKYVHFSNLNEDDELMDLGLESARVPEKIVAIDEEISKVKYGIDVLSKYDTRPTGLKAMKEGKETLEFSELEEKALGIDYSSILKKIKEADKDMEALKREEEQFRTKINELEPWKNLDVPMSAFQSMEVCEVFLGTIPKRNQESVQQDLIETQYTYFEIIDEHKNKLYVVAITADDEVELVTSILRANNFVEVKFDINGVPKEEIESLQNQIRIVEQEYSSRDEELKGYSMQLPKLEIVYDYMMNRRLRIASSENFLMAGEIQVIEGYVPTDKMDEFLVVIKSSLNNVYYIETEDAKEDDPDVPILLENSKFTTAFESLTSMYALPKYNEIDPTPFFAVFHILFFGMMVADFGYGLLIFLGTFIALKFFNLAESQKVTIRFYFYGGIATMLWGLIFGSFFGGVISMPALIDPMTEYNRLLIISIALGIVHIFYALGIKAYINIRDGKPWDALFDTGFWYMALVGAIIMLLVYVDVVQSSMMEVAKWVMIAGMVGIVLTGGRDSASIGGKIGGGLYSLYGITSYIGDFVSYSRLMALGLSGGYIAYAINLMVGMLMGIGVLGATAGVVVFVVGHLFNLFLSALSGYVHSIRLTYVEFFGKFYEGGGKTFKKLISQTKYINLKK